MCFAYIGAILMEYSETHKLELKQVCRRCGDVYHKQKVKSLSESTKNAYKEFWGIDLNDDDEYMAPSVLCPTCYCAIRHLKSGNASKVGENSRSYSQCNFANINKAKTRFQIQQSATLLCSVDNICDVCNKYIEYKSRNVTDNKALFAKSSAGRKKVIPATDVDVPKPICPKCFKELTSIELNAMETHKCMGKEKSVMNCTTVLNKANIEEQVMSNILDNNINDDDSDTTSTISVSRLRGHSMKVSINHHRKKSPERLTLKSLIGIKGLSNCVSNNNLKKINSILLEETNVRFPSVNRLYEDRRKCLGNLFDYEFIMNSNRATDDHTGASMVNNKASFPLVYCNDIQQLVEGWLKPSANKQITTLKISVDHGQDFLKISLQIIDNPKFANSVSHLLLLAVVEVPESREILQYIFALNSFKRLFNDPNFTIVICADIKCHQLMLGISTGNAKFPCIFCTWEQRSPIGQSCNTLRTGKFQNDHYQLFQNEHNSDKKKAQLVYNCIAPSIFECTEQEIILQCGFPILHVTLGIFQHIFDRMEYNLSEDEKPALWLYLKTLGVNRANYHGGAFEGRSVHKILNNLKHAPECLKKTTYYTALQRYENFLTFCGGVERLDGWAEAIHAFQEAFKETDIAPFVKVHLLDHLPVYFENVLDKIASYPNPGLALVSEQAIESSHHFFKSTWERYKKYSVKKNLLEAVIDFNYSRFINSFK